MVCLGKGDALQRGMDELGKNGCTNDVCSSALKIQDGKDAIACTIPSRVPEDVGVAGNGRCLTDVPWKGYADLFGKGSRQSQETSPRAGKVR